MDEHMIPLEEARRIVLAHVAPTEVVEVDAWRAVGLPLAEDVVTDIDLSPFANSAMDGYAVHARTSPGRQRGLLSRSPSWGTRPRAMSLRARLPPARQCAS